MFRKNKEHVCEWQAIAYVKTDINNGLSKSIQRVIELHKPSGTPSHPNELFCDECSEWNGEYDLHPYPCDTIKALNGDES